MVHVLMCCFCRSTALLACCVRNRVFFFIWSIKTEPSVLLWAWNTVYQRLAEVYLMKVDADEVYILVSQPRKKTLMKQDTSAEQNFYRKQQNKGQIY